MHNKYHELTEIIKGYGRLAVAFSNGIDSTFLLKTAHDVLGDGVLAITVDAPNFPSEEAEEAKKYCESLGVRHVVINYDILSLEQFSSNPPDRCYYCKKALFSEIVKVASENGIDVVADGSNADDMSDIRPGMKALGELSIKSPLMEAGLAKSDIRALAKEQGVTIWDKPAFACLASRIAFGEEITEDKLGMIEDAEEYIREFGVRQIRVRMHDSMARIETLPTEFDEIMAHKDEIYARLQEMGFTYVSLDLQGYRTGSMNEGSVSKD